VVGLLLFVSIVGIPWLIRRLIGGALAVQEVVIERDPPGSRRRSSEQLVAGNRWRTARLVLLLYAVGLPAAPPVGFAFLLVTSITPGGVDLIGSVVYAFTLPYVALASTLLYFDLQDRQRGRAHAQETASPFWRRAAAVGAVLAAAGVVVLAASAL